MGNDALGTIPKKKLVYIAKLASNIMKQKEEHERTIT